MRSFTLFSHSKSRRWVVLKKFEKLNLIVISLIIGLIFHVFVILQFFFDGWFESRNTGKMWILEKFKKFEKISFFSRY